MTQKVPRYYVLDGRHRLRGAQMRGAPSKLRCDVLTRSGHDLRILEVAHLEVDPEVQLDFAYRERFAKHLAATWDDRLVGVLTVVDVADSLLARDKAQIKGGIDGDRRHVTALEAFLTRLTSGDDEATTIAKVVEYHGFHVGHGGKRDTGRIEAVTVLTKIYRRLGSPGLDMTLTLAEVFRDQPVSNRGEFLEGLAILVRDRYVQSDDDVRGASARWAEVAPAIVVRYARGAAVDGYHGGNNSGFSSVGYEVAAYLRRKAGWRTRPAVQRPGGYRARTA